MGILGIVGVGPDLQPARRLALLAPCARRAAADLVGPAEQGHQVVCSSNFGATVGIWPTKTSPVVPSTLIQSPSLTTCRLPLILRASRSIDIGRADHAGLAELAGDHGGVAGGAAFAGQNTLGGDHAVHVVRLGNGRTMITAWLLSLPFLGRSASK